MVQPEQKQTAAAVEEKDELASAFDAPVAVAERMPTLPDDTADKFRAALAVAVELLGSGHAAEALPKAEEALSLSQQCWSADRSAAHDAQYKALWATDKTAAFAAAKKWFDECGPDDIAPCRLAAATAMNQSAGQKSVSKEDKAQAPKTLKLEKCLTAGEKTGRADACLKEADQGDAVSKARAFFIRALAEKTAVKKVASMAQLAAQFKEPKAAGVRLAALEAVAAQKLADGEHEAAVRALIDGHQGLVAAVDSSLRRWVRSPAFDATCVAFDEKTKPGTCRALERKLTGGWTFRDFSRQVAGEALSADAVRQVNEHYNPLIQECLTAQARRMTAPASDTWEVKWIVLNDGRVTEVTMRQDFGSATLASCMKAQFAWWRYPRYEGEFQHVQQNFAVKAAQRK